MKIGMLFRTGNKKAKVKYIMTPITVNGGANETIDLGTPKKIIRTIAFGQRRDNGGTGGTLRVLYGNDSATTLLESVNCPSSNTPNYIDNETKYQARYIKVSINSATYSCGGMIILYE